MALLVKRANASMQAVCIRLIIYNNKRFARNNERANVIHRVVCSAALVNCYYYWLLKSCGTLGMLLVVDLCSRLGCSYVLENYWKFLVSEFQTLSSIHGRICIWKILLSSRLVHSYWCVWWRSFQSFRPWARLGRALLHLKNPQLKSPGCSSEIQEMHTAYHTQAVDLHRVCTSIGAAGFRRDTIPDQIHRLLWFFVSCIIFSVVTRHSNKAAHGWRCLLTGVPAMRTAARREPAGRHDVRSWDAGWPAQVAYTCTTTALDLRCFDLYYWTCKSSLLALLPRRTARPVREQRTVQRLSSVSWKANPYQSFF
jgi:hypothetical protein